MSPERHDERLRVLQKEEHEAWQALCCYLVEIDAVTQEDLTSPLSANDTPGQRLLNQIRRWERCSRELSQWR